MSGLLVKQGAFKNIEDVEEYAGWMFELASAESVTNRVHSDQAEECQKDLVPRPDLLFKLGLSDGSDSRLLEKNRAVSGSVCVCVLVASVQTSFQYLLFLWILHRACN